MEQLLLTSCWTTMRDRGVQVFIQWHSIDSDTVSSLSIVSAVQL